jgi:hypothetical protein
MYSFLHITTILSIEIFEGSLQAICIEAFEETSPIHVHKAGQILTPLEQTLTKHTSEVEYQQLGPKLLATELQNSKPQRYIFWEQHCR